jgi:hypothetical protein
VEHAKREPAGAREDDQSVIRHHLRIEKREQAMLCMDGRRNEPIETFERAPHAGTCFDMYPPLFAVLLAAILVSKWLHVRLHVLEGGARQRL